MKLGHSFLALMEVAADRSGTDAHLETIDRLRGS